MKNEFEIQEIGVRNKLKLFKENVKGEEEIVYDFVDFLSTYISDSLVPAGFNMGVSLALYDAIQGRNGFSRKPITHKIVEYPSEELALLMHKIPMIANAIFNNDFARATQEFYSRIVEEKEGNRSNLLKTLENSEEQE